MKRTLLLLLLAFALKAQDVTDLAAILNAARSVQSVILALTGTDGTVCTISKVQGASINAIFKCNSADGKQFLKPSTITSTSAASGYTLLGQGSVLCLVGVNPTAAPVTFGSVGTAPPAGIAYSCTADGATIKTGTAVWP